MDRAPRTLQQRAQVSLSADLPLVQRVRTPTRQGEYVSPEVLDARENFAAFREFVCGHGTYPIHRGWEPHLNTGQDSKNLRGIAGRNTLILSWRGSTKSTYTLEWVAFQIGRHITAGILFKVLYVSFNLEVAILKSTQLQAIIETPAYQAVFPKCRKDKDFWARKTWAIDFGYAGLTTTEEPYTLACCGITGSTASKRAHLVVLDDIIPDEKKIENPKIRLEMIRKWDGIIKPTIYDGGRAVCLATLMHPDDIFNTTFIEPTWQVIRESALVLTEAGEEVSAWGEDQHEPFAQSTKFLLAKREESPTTFSFQYMNIVVRQETQSINPALCIKGIVPAQLDYLVLGCDLSAADKQKNDYTALVLGGVVWLKQMPKFYIIDAWQGRILGNVDKLKIMMEMWQRWKHLLPTIRRMNGDGEVEEIPVTGLELHFESNAYQKSLKGDYEYYILGQQQIYDWLVVPVPSVEDKLLRLRSVSGMFDNQLITFNLFGSLMGTVINQLTNFGATAHDDLMDATVLCLQGLRTKFPSS